MDYISLYIIAVVIGFIPAIIAYDKGRRFWPWWIFGTALFLVALPVAIFLKPNIQGQEEEQIEVGEVKKCPYCAGTTSIEDRVCRFCGRDLVDTPSLVRPENIPVLSVPAEPLVSVSAVRRFTIEDILEATLLLLIFLLTAFMGLLILTNLNY